MLKGFFQKNPIAKLRRSMLLIAGLSLVIATQSLAAPASEVITEEPLPFTVTASGYHSVVKTPDGDVWYWGGIADVIDGKHTFRDNTPQHMNGLQDVADIQSYHQQELILKKDGTVWDWGSEYKLKSAENNDGTTHFPDPKQVEGLTSIVKISAGGIASAIDKDGSVWVWHPSYYFSGPHKLKNITDAKDISANGNGEVLILRENGMVWKWTGYTDRNANTDYNASKIEGLTDVTALSSGQGQHNFAIKKDGTVWGWGESFGGKLGLPESAITVDPVEIKGLSDVSSIVTGLYSTLVLKTDGTLWVMGYDVGEDLYLLKHGPELRRIEGLEKVTAMALGYYHAVAVTANGAVVAWGSNKVGQLGDASFKDSSTLIVLKVIQ